MLDKTKYEEIMRAEMKPDCYSGPNCDEIRPRWMSSVEKEGDIEIGNDIKLDASTFPPGTRVIIKVPECPNEECDLNADFAEEGKCFCGFDWEDWTINNYS